MLPPIQLDPTPLPPDADALPAEAPRIGNMRLDLPRLRLTPPRPAAVTAPARPPHPATEQQLATHAVDSDDSADTVTPPPRQLSPQAMEPMVSQLARDRTRIAVLMVFAVAAIVAIAVGFEAQLEGFTFA